MRVQITKVLQCEIVLPTPPSENLQGVVKTSTETLHRLLATVFSWCAARGNRYSSGPSNQTKRVLPLPRNQSTPRRQARLRYQIRIELRLARACRCGHLKPPALIDTMQRSVFAFVKSGMATPASVVLAKRGN